MKILGDLSSLIKGYVEEILGLARDPGPGIERTVEDILENIWAAIIGCGSDCDHSHCDL